MKCALIAVLSIGLACEAGAASITSNSSSVNSSTSINNSVTSSTSTSSDTNVNTSTSVTSSTGGGTSTSTCTTINNQQQCEVTCERPRVARCIEATAGKAPSCTCQKPRKKRKPG